MSKYVLYVESAKTEHVVSGNSPAKALAQLVEMAGLELAKQEGRYGRLTDGRSVSALTAKWGRSHYSDARTTRL